ncbi:MAG TPA: hypothetical protein VJA22_00405, partial [Patescibacteria group bacterium]|nr:hypothetical protein [Patescibacteria group bacterium]
IHSEQNINPTPAIWHVFLGFGLVFLFALFGIARLRKQQFEHRLENVFLLTWLVFGFFILYSGFPYERRFIEGLLIPMAIFASYPVSVFLENIVKNRARLRSFIFAYLMGAALFTTNVVLVIAYCVEYSESRAKKFSMEYVHEDVVSAFDWLKRRTGEESIILSHPVTGNFIPAHSGRRVFIGHGIMTLSFNQKRSTVKRFFTSNDLDAEKIKFLRDHHITHIFWSELEDSLGTYQPSEKEYLTEVYRNERVIVFAVRNE